MFEYIIGNIRRKDMTSVVLENNRIGYILYCPASTLIHLNEEGTEVCLYTYFSVREDGISLYGFLTKDELELFKLLISISKIGPKIGLAILSSMTPSEVVVAIKMENGSAFAKVSGVGKKTSERILLELRDKIDHIGLELKSISRDFPVKSDKLEDVYSALTSLGYSQPEIQKVLKEVGEQVQNMNVDEIIKYVLKNMSHF